MIKTTADGSMLTPFVILNRETIPKETFCDNVVVWTQTIAWMMNYLHKIGLGVYGTLWISETSQYVCDAFHAHCLIITFKTKLTNVKCNLVVIPGGMTS